jgi:hypothetical protein
MYPIIGQSIAASFEGFITFWSALYNYSLKAPFDNKYYEENIHKDLITIEKIEALFS